jgi:hypothetical protein
MIFLFYKETTEINKPFAISFSISVFAGLHQRKSLISPTLKVLKRKLHVGEYLLTGRLGRI